MRYFLTIAAIAATAVGLTLPSLAQGATKKLYATVGPDDTITLKTAAGARVRSIKAGRYTIVVRDRGDDHNFRLFGRGLSKATTVGFVGRKVWRNVTLRRGKTYTFQCDPHADHMRGSFRAR